MSSSSCPLAPLPPLLLAPPPPLLLVVALLTLLPKPSLPSCFSAAESTSPLSVLKWNAGASSGDSAAGAAPAAAEGEGAVPAAAEGEDSCSSCIAAAEECLEEESLPLLPTIGELAAVSAAAPAAL